VRRGRLAEFAPFGWEKIPDPQDPETFERSRPDWSLRFEDGHAHLLSLYRRLIELRRSSFALASCRSQVEATSLAEENLLVVSRSRGEDHYLLLASFNDHPVTPHLALPRGLWRCLLDTSWERFGGRELMWAHETVLSQGQPVMLRFNPHAALLYGRTRTAEGG